MPHSAEERKSFLSEKKLQSSYRGYQPLIDAFGANGVIEGVEALPLEIPEGLDEKTVAAIVVGASLNPDRLAYPMGDFGVGTDIVLNNQRLIMEQAAGGQVPPQTAQILSAGRRDAKAALEAYKAGDDSLVKKHLRTYADHAVKKISEFMPDSNDLSIAGQSITLINDVLDENKFGIEPSGLPIAKSKLKVYRKANDARAQANAKQQRLLNEFDTLTKEEKEQLAAEMLFNGYVSAIPGTDQKQFNELSHGILNRALLSVGVTPQDKELYDQVRMAPGIKKAERKLNIAYNNTTITNEEVILAQDNGVDQLEDLSMAQIRQSELFNSIVDAKNKDELTDALIDAEAKFTEGLGSVAGVAVPVVNKELNAEKELVLETEIRGAYGSIPEAAAQSEAFRDESTKYTLDALEPMDFKKTADQAKKINDILDDAAPKEKSTAYTEIMHAVQTVQTIAEECAEKEFVCSSEAQIVASEFNQISNKISSFIQSGAETDVKMLKAFQQANLMAVAAGSSININRANRIEQAIQDNGSEFNNSIIRQRHANFDKYPGKLYADPDKRPAIAGIFTPDRTAGHALASLFMCSQGYSIEDIVDPDKLAAEKQAAFSHIMDVLKQPADQAKKMIGKMIYDGRKAEAAQINELAKKIDFSDPDFRNKHEMRILAQMAMIDFDITQEMARLKPEVTEAAKADTKGVINSYKEYLEAYPIMSISNYVSAEGVINKAVGNIMTETDPEALKKSLAQIAASRAQQNYILDAYRDAQQKNPDKPFTRLLPTSFSPQAENVGARSSDIVQMKDNPLDALANDHKFVQKNIKVLLDGPFLDARPDKDPVTGELILEKGLHPKVTKLPGTSQLEIKVLTATMDEKLSVAAASAKEARKKVFFGKKDFADAVTAVEELNSLRNGAAAETDKQIPLETQRKKAEEARQKIDAYLNRKAKEEREGAHFSARTQKCIDAMKACRYAVDAAERSLRDQKKESAKQQEQPQAKAPNQADIVQKDKTAVAGKMQHNDKAPDVEVLLNSKLEEIRTVFKGKLGGEETCPAGEDKEVYLEGQKEQLAEFCSLTISANTIGGKLKKMAANPALKDADFKDALSVDSIKLGARVVEERPDFKQMIAKIKTWEDFSKLKNIAVSGNGKQLIDELHKKTGEIERTQNRRFSRTKQLEKNGKPVTKEQKQPEKGSY